MAIATTRKRSRAAVDSLKQLVGHIRHENTDREQNRKRLRRAPTLEEMILPRKRVVQPGSTRRIEGDKRCRRLRTALATFTTRSRQQIIFQEIFTQANMKNLYQGDYEAHELRIKSENFMDSLFQFALVSCPRRWGKSMGTSQWVAAWIVSQEDTNVLIFSPGKRQSQDLLNMMKKFIKEFRDEKGYSFEIGQDNAENFEVIHPSGKSSRIRALPAKEETTRGATGDVVILEEAAMMQVPFVMNVVFPVVSMQDNVLLGISTLKDQDNYYSLLANIRRPDGTKLFNSFTFVQACEDCIKEGTAADCVHKLHERPAWVSGTKQDLLKHVYRVLGFEKLLLQEQIGMSNQATENAFKKPSVMRLFKTPPLELKVLDQDPEVVYIGFDPNMGGKGSDFGLCSMFFDRGTAVIVGLEAVPALTEREYMVCAERHMLEVRKQPGLKHCLFVVIVESNLRFQAQNIARHILDSVHNCVVMRKDGFDISSVQVGHGVGMHTAPKVKEEMYAVTNNCLDADQMRFFEHFVTTYQASSKEGEMDAKIRVQMQLKDQLLSYLVELKLPNDPAFQTIRKSYSGKRGGRKDDLAVIMQLVNYWGRVCMVRPDMVGVHDQTVRDSARWNALGENGGRKRPRVDVEHRKLGGFGDFKRQRR